MANTNVTFSTLGQPVKNDCSPERVYGGFEQTLFLGSSVSSVSASAGWNEQASDVTVTLVDDPCPAPAAKPKVYWNSGLNKRTTTAADPGFIGETVNIIGTPVYFRVGDFEYSGIVQSWEKDRGTSGNPTYTVKLSDGRDILSGVHLIVNEYAGGVGSQFNIFNVYGYMESFGESCPLTTINGAQFGTPAGGFGGSGSNTNGMAANDINRGFNVLANSIPRATNNYSPYGRIVSKGTTGGSYGVVNYDNVALGLYLSEYFVDTSELPTVPSYYRISGVSTTLLEYVSQVCQDAGYDYYWEMIMVKNQFIAGSGIAKFLKLRTVSRLTQPQYGAIQDFVDNGDGTTSNSVGRELRQDTMASFLIGGNVEGVYQTNQDTDPGWDGTPSCDEEDDMILPYLGVHSSNQNLIIPCKDANDEWEFTVSTTELNATMAIMTLPATVTIREFELRAVEGSMDAWLNIEGAYVDADDPSDIGTEIFNGANNLYDKTNSYSGLMTPFIEAAVDEEKTTFSSEVMGATAKVWVGEESDAQAEDKLADAEAIYEWLKGYSNLYGTHFMVRVPDTCAIEDPESTKPVYSEQPQQDGWTDESAIIGLSTSGTPIEFFRNESGKVEAMARYDTLTQVNLTEIDVNTYITDGSSIWVKAQVEQGEWAYHTHSTKTAPRAIISISTPIRKKTDQTTSDKGLKKAFDALLDARVAVPALTPDQEDDKWTKFKKMFEREGGDLFASYFPENKEVISAASFGIKNNVLTYGPWTNVGRPGPIRIERNDGLVPWEYDGTAAMNTAGQALASEGLANMVVGEMGSVSVPGYPSIPLGAEIGAVAGGYFGGGSNLIENRNHSVGSFTDTLPGGGSYSANYGFFTYGDSWTGLYGPNITGISISVGSDGLTTNYTMRTYTPKFGRFTKLNADRLRQQNQLKRDIHRERAQRRLSLGAKILKSVANKKQRSDAAKDRAKGQDPGTSHHVLTSSVGANTNYSPVSSKSVFDVNREIAGDYANKHFMGLDSVFVPYDTANIVGQSGSTRFTKDSLPTVLSGECGDTSGAPGPYVITASYLNPWSNPASSGGGPASRQENSGEHGHNQSFAGRGTSLSAGEKLHLRAQGIINGETNDWAYASNYRTMAFRGPMNIRMWGYDTDGKPVPNAADTEYAASGGNYATTDLEDNFLDGFLKKPETWPVAPMDLRLDRERGVWVSPPQPRNLMVELCGCLTGSGVVAGKIIDSMNMYDDAGDAIGEKYVNVSHRFGNNKGRKYGTGERVYVTYDAHSDGYVSVDDEGMRIQVVSGSGSGGDDVLSYDDYGRVLRFSDDFSYSVPTGAWADCADIVEVTMGDPSATGCMPKINGRYVDNIPIASGDDVEYVLGVSTEGCVVRVPVVLCSTGTG